MWVTTDVSDPSKVIKVCKDMPFSKVIFKLTKDIWRQENEPEYHKLHPQ